MAALVYLFIQNINASFWVAHSLFSTCIGVFGYCQLFGVNWDVSALVAILLTVGINVDFTVHITYHFFTNQLPADANDEESIQRLKWAICSLCDI